uniref:Cuticle protein n=1 Tax=Glossina morsitans morsitans TaxID=37546 RepID=A0A1B0GF84_GLOMM
MYKLNSVCMLAVLSVVAAVPALIAPIGYTAPVTSAAYTAPVGYTGPATAAVVGHTTYVAPYSSSYTAHSIAHTALFSAPATYVSAVKPHFDVPSPLVVAAPHAPLLLKK